jgi:hypothetical protein
VYPTKSEGEIAQTPLSAVVVVELRVLDVVGVREPSPISYAFSIQCHEFDSFCSLK